MIPFEDLTIDEIIDALIAEINQLFKDMKPDERVKFLSSIVGKYCHECGQKMERGYCHCMNDE